MSEQARFAWLVAGFVLLIAASLGCATTAALSSDNKAEYYGTPVLSDTVVAAGRPDAALAEQMGNPHVVAFLGRKNTYLLAEGGEELLQMAQQLDGSQIALEGRTRGLYLQDKKVWGTLSLSYGKPGRNDYAAEQLAALNRLGFVPVGKSGVYRKQVAVKGLVYPALALPAGQEQHFSVSRELVFFPSPQSKAPPDFSKLIKVPAAIAVDVVTLPLQLAIAGLAVLTISTAHH